MDLKDNLQVVSNMKLSDRRSKNSNYI